PLPRPTLFPYTTLFRSCTPTLNSPCLFRIACNSDFSRSNVRFHIFQNFIVKCTRSRETRILANGHDTLAACPKACPHLSPPVSTDRKSTRLNSSHEWIS